MIEIDTLKIKNEARALDYEQGRHGFRWRVHQVYSWIRGKWRALKRRVGREQAQWYTHNYPVSWQDEEILRLKLERALYRTNAEERRQRSNGGV